MAFAAMAAAVWATSTPAGAGGDSLAGFDAGDPGTLVIQASLPIYLGPDEPDPILRAVEDLQRDFRNVLGRAFPLVRDKDLLGGGPAILVVGPSSDVTTGSDRWVEGWEAHRVFVEPAGEHPRIVLQGADTRGAIYAVYSFSEHILGIPPSWVWTSHQVDRRQRVEVPLSTDLHFGSPHVKWRVWFPNDQDYLEPWKAVGSNRSLVAETLLRLKLNAWDTGSILNESVTGIVADVRTARDHGIVVLSTHTTPLGVRVEQTRWNNYWTNIRGQEPPALLLANKEALIDYWRHGLLTVLGENLETVWTVTFRGHGDVGFWNSYPDAPAGDAARAAVIQEMIGHQLDLLAEHVGEDAVVRIPLYNEMSDYFLAGLLELPAGENFLWNLVAARRDHYPPAGVFDMNFPADQPLGLYFNIQFTSTGSHVVQGEGPWKMEANFRAIEGLNPPPLGLSMVNTGNIREFIPELEANASMMWDFNGFDATAFMEEFCARYFGEEHGPEAALLYRDFFHSYWEQRPPTIDGFERQFIFHDLRFSRAMREILTHVEQGRQTVEPLGNMDFYRVDPAHSGSANTLDAILAGTAASLRKLEEIAGRADDLRDRLEPGRRVFFNDNLRGQIHFMLRLNESLHQLALALRHVNNPWRKERHAAAAHRAFTEARDVLRQAEHGRFANWYPRPGDRDLFHFNAIESRMENLHEGGGPLPVTTAFNDDLPDHRLLWETDFSSAAGWGNITGGRGFIDTSQQVLSSLHDGIAGPFATLGHAAVLGDHLDLEAGERTVTALHFNGRFDGVDSTDLIWVRLRSANPRGTMPNIAAGLRGNGTLTAMGIGSHERLLTSSGNTSLAAGDISGVSVSQGDDFLQYRLVMETLAGAGTMKLTFDWFDVESGEWLTASSLEIPGYRDLLGEPAHSRFDQLSVFFRTPGEYVSDLAITQWTGEGPPNAYDAWRASKFAPEDVIDDLISGPLADPDRDGISNLLEFALGGNPWIPRDAFAPELVSAESGAGPGLRFFRARDASGAVRYEVQASVDLNVWETVWSSLDHPYSSYDDTERVTVVDDRAGARRFLRLRVSLVE